MARVIDLSETPYAAYPETQEPLTEPDPYEQQFAQLANRVRTVYCLCFREFTNNPDYGQEPMPRWDGDPEGVSGTRTQPVWPLIARRIAEIGADPFLFIRAQFFGTRRGRPPYPNQCYSDKAVELYQHFLHEQAKDVEQCVRSDDNQIQIHATPLIASLGWSREQAVDYALRSSNCHASALVKYCHAESIRSSFSAVLRDRALVQYLFQMQAYDAILGNRIDQTFRADAYNLRQRLLRG